MKITNVNTYLVRPRWGFVEIETDEGITGWGEPVVEGKAATVQACVEEMKPYLIGADPMRIEDIWTGSLPGRLLPRRPDPYERHCRH